MGHYIYKSIPDAKFEVDSSFSFGDMTSQNVPQKKGTSHPIQLFTPRKTDLTLKKTSFYVQNRPSRHKIDPHVNFNNFQEEENFSFSKFLGRLDDERAAATP